MRRLIDANALMKKYTMVTKRYSGGSMERPAVLLETIETAPTIQTKEVKYFDEDENVWKIGSVIVE